MSAAPAESPGTKKSAFKNKHSTYERDPLDFYVEPHWCTELLIDNYAGWTNVWDPACGQSTIPAVFKDRGVQAQGTDIVCQRLTLSFVKPLNFLHDEPLGGWKDIVTNPPYKHAEAFIRRAHELKARKIAVLVRLDFLASLRRHSLFSELPPQQIIVLSRRPSMPRGPIRDDIKRSGGQHDYCWIIWDGMKAWHPCQVQWVK